MATTKIWPIKASLSSVVDYANNPEKTEYEPLREVLHYADNGEKTKLENEKVFLSTGIGCSSQHAFEDMMSVQQYYGKTAGNVAYHAYQSFKPNEVTPEECHQLGVELAEKMWGDKYQVLVATHLNTGTYHNHFVINAVSFRDGRKYDCNKKAYYQFRDMSDRICKEHGLSVIEHPHERTPRQLYLAEKRGEPTKYNNMREAIDLAISLSLRPRDFQENLLAMGYELDLDPGRKHPVIRAIGDKRNTRMERLGEGYTPDSIYDRILSQPFQHIQDTNDQYVVWRNHQENEIRNIPHHRLGTKDSPVTAVLTTVLYLMGVDLFPDEPHRNHYQPLSAAMKEASRYLDRILDQHQLASGYHVTSMDALMHLIETLEKQLERFLDIRKGVINRMRRCKDPQKMIELKAARTARTQSIVKLRKEIKIAKSLVADYDREISLIKAEGRAQDRFMQKQAEIKSPRNRSRDRER